MRGVHGLSLEIPHRRVLSHDQDCKSEEGRYGALKATSASMMSTTEGLA